jgi:hypothetical protein
MLTAERLVEVIERRCKARKESILVFWCQVVYDREEVCKRVNELKGNMHIISFVLRGTGFENPNAILSDLNELICEYRNQLEPEASRAFSNNAPIIILLLSRTEFTLPQISSFTVLPDWFPQLGAQSVYIEIEDLTGTADGPLNIPESHIDDLCEKLFRLEVSLISRLSEVEQKDPEYGRAFFADIRDGRKQNERPLEFLDDAKKYHNEVQTPRGFRPSAKEGRSIVGRLLRLMRITPPDQIGQKAKMLSIALGIYDLNLPIVDDSLASILLRPISRDINPSIRFARNIIVTIYASSQFVTAAAHSDDYPFYPVLLLRSISYNLRSVLDELTCAIKQLNATDAREL